MQKIETITELSETALYDIELLGLSNRETVVICDALRELPCMDGDEPVGPLLKRDFGKHSVLFDIMRSGDELVVTVIRVMPTQPIARTERLNWALSILANLRSALGV